MDTATYTCSSTDGPENRSRCFRSRFLFSARCVDSHIHGLNSAAHRNTSFAAIRSSSDEKSLEVGKWCLGTAVGFRMLSREEWRSELLFAVHRVPKCVLC
jgi:hypothetical protein